MSTKRTSPSAGYVGKVQRNDNGRPLCRRCQAECPAPLRTFCSDACIHEWRLRSDPGYLRQIVFLRDWGVCAGCAVDTEQQRRKAASMPWRDREVYLESLGAKGRVSLWDADHIVPVVEGGGECGIENIQTLCCRCHKAATAALRKRLAAQKRQLRCN